MSRKLAALSALALVLSAPLYAANYSDTTHFNLIGVNSSIQAEGNYGKGVLFGVIDTGIAAPWIGFQNRINTAQSVCEISGCSKTLAITDDNGHGTFVTSEILGNASSFVGIDPQANAIAVKVLAANGSGYVSNVANGINYAANQGAKVLNLSMTFVPTGGLLGAINNAAAKGAVIVFAGGNDGGLFQNGARIGGLTDKAIQNLVLMGSISSSKTISYFSTKPGSGGFISTSGKFYSFASRWMMADGENLYGASNYHDNTGYDYLTMMSGTSMSAPQAAGVAGLLAARWPFLITNGTVAQIMLASTQDLGTSGVDSTFGSGLMRADQAFNPIGTMSIPVNGTYIPVSQAELMANGKVNTAAVKAALAKGVAYDTYKRDFKTNLSAAVSSSSSSSSVTSVVTGRTASGGGTSGRSFTDLGDGSWMTASFSDSGANSVQPSAGMNRGGFTEDPRMSTSQWSAGFYSEGTYMGAGHGMSQGGAYSFNDARWNGTTAFFDTPMAGAGSLLGLGEAGTYASGGFQISDSERVSFGVIMGRDDLQTMLMGNEISSQGFAVGYTRDFDKDLSVSATASFLNEKNALLGAPSAGYLRVGQDAKSMGFGISANYNMGDGLQLGLDATAASTNPADNPDSLIAHTSRLTSVGFGAALRKENLTGHNDTLTASITSPLHVISGSADVNVPTGADPNTGAPIYSHDKASLAATGMEVDFGVGYTRPLAENAKASFALEFRNDADNVPGQTDEAVMFRLTKAF